MFFEGLVMQCPCGGATAQRSERHKKSVLTYERCPHCGRCDKHTLYEEVGGVRHLLNTGQDARQRYLAAKEG